MLPMTSELSPQAAALFHAHRDQIFRRTDRWFAYLMICQYVACILFAITISPRTWSGAMSQVHPHVWAAVVLGAAIAALPVTLAYVWPGRFLTRVVISIGQMLTSALLIHLTGGRIETHFHVFGSLAFLAFYRDWRVLIPATLVVAGDHLIRGIVWPESVYGVAYATPWRSLEHAGWVIFEDIFIIRSCIQGVREMKEIATRRADIEAAHAEVETKVRQRTAELTEKQQALQEEIAKREAMHKRLVDISRRAGMAEVATGVLHNVGNVLNSVNVAATVLSERIRKAPTDDLAAISQMVNNQTDLANFLTSDSKGKLVPRYLNALADHLTTQRTENLKELEQLIKSIEHIRDIVSTQQSYARVAGTAERVQLVELIEDAIRINSEGLRRHKVALELKIENRPLLNVEKQKVLQILVNLISNAKYAMDGMPTDNRRLTIRVSQHPDNQNRAQVWVIDNGVGIPKENITRIFSHGFTTRLEGHGFGLHSSALAAKEMDGSLMARSDGPGKGATFILELPLDRVEALNEAA
jgi:signal transduction histidine kinase